MESRRPAPPSGEPPPETARIGERDVALDPLARSIYEQYRVRFPDYEARYGDAAEAWCVHDTKYLLSWAALDVGLGAGGRLFVEQVTWLAELLARRSSPLDQLAEHFGFVADALTGTAPDLAGAWDDLAGRGSATVRGVAGSRTEAGA